MGTRISQAYLDEMRRRARPPETDLFLSPAAASYGFILNIAHPAVEPYYRLYKKYLRRTAFPLDDWERKLFEADMIYYLFREQCAKRYNESVVQYYAGLLIRYRDAAERWRQYREQHAAAAARL